MKIKRIIVGLLFLSFLSCLEAYEGTHVSIQRISTMLKSEPDYPRLLYQRGFLQLEPGAVNLAERDYLRTLELEMESAKPEKVLTCFDHLIARAPWHWMDRKADYLKTLACEEAK
jgi:hypothetical protein